MVEQRNSSKKRIRKIDFSTHFAVGVSVAADPDDPHFPSMEDYSEMITEKLAFFDSVASAFKRSKLGSEYDRNETCIRILCSFPIDRRGDFSRTLLRPLIQKISTRSGISLLCGVGLPAANHLHIEESLATSRDSMNLKFFEPGSFFEYQKIRRHIDVSFEDYEKYSEEAFKLILMKSPKAIETIDRCMDLIRKIHYGNRSAVIMRAMNFTGELAYRLHRYNFLDVDFYQMQDALQEKVLSAKSYEEVKSSIHDYYETLLADIFSNSHIGRKTIAEQIKTYIRENYFEDLTIQKLSEIACVSPGYFSHLFKDETGESCKSYLTKVRMDAAAELLSASDYRLYEISEKVGYNNVRNFLTAFKNTFGCSPSEYKKQLQQKSGL